MNATTAPPPLLALKGVSKRFGALEALIDVDFEVDAGEGLHGPEPLGHASGYEECAGRGRHGWLSRHVRGPY